MTKMNPVVHFEMPAEDKKRVAEFYTKVFGWKMQQLGPEMGDYLLAHTTETDENYMVKKPGAINEGFFQKGKDGTIPHIVISVDNLEHQMKEVKKSGGEMKNMQQPINKKESAVSFLLLVSSGKVREAYDKYIHQDFCHHNPYFKGDRESFLVGMEESSVEFPHKVFEVMRVLEDGDFVVVHGKIRMKSDSPEIALIHIFRFEGDRIIEEWEASQRAPKESPNENGMF